MYEARQCKEWVTASIDKGKIRGQQLSIIEEVRYNSITSKCYNAQLIS